MTVVILHLLFWLWVDINYWVNMAAVMLSGVGIIGGTWFYYNKVLPRL